MMFEILEMEGVTPPDSEFHSIVTSFGHALKRLLANRIVEQREILEPVKAIQWRLKEIDN